MKETIPPIVHLLISFCFLTLTAFSIYLLILSFITKKYFGKVTEPLDMQGLENATADLRKQYETDYERFNKDRKTTFYQATFSFSLVSFMFAYSTFTETNTRWIDIAYKIGLIINGIAILHSFHFTKRKKLISLLIYFNASMYLFFAGAYMGIGDFLNAPTGIILYIIMIINYNFLNKIRREQEFMNRLKREKMKLNVKIIFNDES